MRTISQATNRGSLLFNLLLLYRLERGPVEGKKDPLDYLTDDTLYNHCWKEQRRSPFAWMPEVWGEFSAFPHLEQRKGDWQARSYASQQYQTNLLNSLERNFLPRQKRYLLRWIKENEVSGSVWALQCAINGKSCRSPLPEGCEELVAQHRGLLGLEEGEEIPTWWPRQHPRETILYFYHLLQGLERWGEKGFTLAPISKVKNHFLKIDQATFWGLSRESGLTTASYPEDTQRDPITGLSPAQTRMRDVFSLRGLKKGEWEFSSFLETDGTSLCVHYRRPHRKGK